MSSRYAALNQDLERLKTSVQMRKQQRRNWMQQLMKDTVSHSDNAVDDGCEAGDGAVNSELELVLVDTADSNSTSVAPSCEREQDQTSDGMLQAAAKQSSENNRTRLH